MYTWQLAVLVGALALGNIAYADDPAGELQQLVDKASAHRVLLVGEVHGTSETPARVAELAAAMASEERPLIVGVEIWRTEQERIDRFIASAGTAEDVPTRRHSLRRDDDEPYCCSNRVETGQQHLLLGVRSAAVEREADRRGVALLPGDVQ